MENFLFIKINIVNKTKYKEINLKTNFELTISSINLEKEKQKRGKG